MPRLRITINGLVQGVGFRPTVYRYAVANHLSGQCWNAGQGVVLDIQGRAEDLHSFKTQLQTCPPPQAVLQTWHEEVLPEQALPNGPHFAIVLNQTGRAKNTWVGPDLAMCAQCHQEIFDPHNRRYHYAFTNCTNCGPRFTIIFDRPYERAQTVMGRFKMCPACQQEYDDPRGRRFHAEPNACPLCGPQLKWGTVQGAPAALHFWPLENEAILQAAVCALKDGKIGAVKGLGGFHIVGDATPGKGGRPHSPN